jgi:hypothetical protein
MQWTCDDDTSGAIFVLLQRLRLQTLESTCCDSYSQREDPMSLIQCHSKNRLTELGSLPISRPIPLGQHVHPDPTEPGRGEQANPPGASRRPRRCLDCHALKTVGRVTVQRCPQDDESRCSSAVEESAGGSDSNDESLYLIGLFGLQTYGLD